MVTACNVNFHCYSLENEVLTTTRRFPATEIIQMLSGWTNGQTVPLYVWHISNVYIITVAVEKCSALCSIQHVKKKQNFHRLGN